MVRTFAVFVTVVVVGLVVGLVGGCGGTPDASPPTSPSPSASRTASATPTAPVMPDAARENTKAGAVAFVKFYIAAFNHAQATGDVSTLKKLGANGCVSCNGVVRTIAATYRRGGHAEGGDWFVTGHEAVPSVRGTWEVDIAGKFKPSTVYSRASDRIGKRAHGGPALTSFYVKHDLDWEVVRWERVDLK